MGETRKRRGRVGRPPLPPAERRSERLMVNLTPGERRRLAAAAERRGETVSDLLRDLALRFLARRR
jgi:hypothetical protein